VIGWPGSVPNGKLENVQRRPRVAICDRRDGTNRVPLDLKLFAVYGTFQDAYDILVRQGIQDKHTAA